MREVGSLVDRRLCPLVNPEEDILQYSKKSRLHKSLLA
jgi:hypothetical protein